MITLAQNLNSKAITQLSGWQFNSYAQAGKYYLAADANGLYILGRDQDGNRITDFNGSNISAHFAYHLDLSEDVRVRSWDCNLETTGNLQISQVFNNRTDDEEDFDLIPYETGLKQHRVKVYGSPRSDYGQNLRLKIANQSGADFSVDAMRMTLLSAGRVRTGR